MTPPALEPVTLNQVKTQLKIDLDDDAFDEQIEPLIAAAREWCEGYQNRAYITQTLELALNDWPSCRNVRLPRPPLQSITSVSYTDAEEIAETWDAANYRMDDYSEPGRLIALSGAVWPSGGLSSTNPIRIRYVGGYGDNPEDVPAKIKQAVLLLVCYWFENGYCDPPQAVKSLLSLDRVVPI